MGSLRLYGFANILTDIGICDI